MPRAAYGFEGKMRNELLRVLGVGSVGIRSSPNATKLLLAQLKEGCNFHDANSTSYCPDLLLDPEYTRVQEEEYDMKAGGDVYRFRLAHNGAQMR